MDKSPKERLLRSNTERLIEWLIENPSKWRVPTPTYRRIKIKINIIRPNKRKKNKITF